jgi:glycerophosphoryl diester phosphodiesterase
VSRTWTTFDRQPTRIIAHRGASGPLPEHTAPAYALALEQGADVLEPDLVISRDGALIVRHDRGLRRSTDIATRGQFAARQCDGDWWVDDFDRSELASLRAIQPFAQRDHRHDGQLALLDFSQLLEWATGAALQFARPLPLYPELKHPAQFAAAGHDIVAAFIAAARDHDARRVPLWLQCFEVEPLRRVREALGLPVFLLLDQHTDWRSSIEAHGSWLSGFGVAKSLLQPLQGAGSSGLVEAAHARGLQVHAWTYRDDSLPNGVDCVEQELEFAFDLGVDAVFCDFPATALACRARWAAA